jgi:hypothetical protein
MGCELGKIQQPHTSQASHFNPHGNVHFLFIEEWGVVGTVSLNRANSKEFALPHTNCSLL